MPSWKVSCRKNPLKYFIMLNIAEIIQGATMQLSPLTIGLYNEVEGFDSEF